MVISSQRRPPDAPCDSYWVMTLLKKERKKKKKTQEQFLEQATQDVNKSNSKLQYWDQLGLEGQQTAECWWW